MALGDSNYKNNQDKMYRPTVYGMAFANTSETAIDQSLLSFSMWKNTIKISIASKLNSNSSKDYVQWDRDNAGCIYLTPVRASMFADILEKFIEEPSKYTGYGIASGKALISVSDGSDGGKPGHWCIIIRLVNESTGKCEKVYGYEIKKNYEAIYGYDNTGNFKTDTDIFMEKEIRMIIYQLRDYSRAANNAYAFTVLDSFSWVNDHTRSALAKIAGACGVDLGAKGTSSGSSKSYFGNQSSIQNTNKQTVVNDINDIDEY